MATAAKPDDDDSWESPPSSPKPSARPKLVAALPQELRKGARNIQFVLDDPPQPVAPSPKSPKSERKPPPIPEKPQRRDSAAPEPDSPQPTVNTKPVPPPKPVSKRLSIDVTALQEVSKAGLDEDPDSVSDPVSDRRLNRKSMHGTFSGRGLKDKLDTAVLGSAPPPTMTSPGREPKSPSADVVETKKRSGSSLSSSIKSLLPKSKSSMEKAAAHGHGSPTSATAPVADHSEDKGLSAGRTALAQSLFLPASSPRSAANEGRPASVTSSQPALRVSLHGFGGSGIGSTPDLGDGAHAGNGPSSTPSSPRGHLSSSHGDEHTESFASWDSVSTPDYLLTWRATLPTAAEPDPLVSVPENGVWRIEQGSVFGDDKEQALYTAPTLNYAEEAYQYYYEGLYHRDHTTWYTSGPEEPSLGPIVLSLETLTPTSKSARILLRSRNGDTRMTMPIQKGGPREVMRAFLEENPHYDKVKWKEVADEELERELIDMERKAVRLMKAYKFGLLLCLDNQREESEMFRNREHTPAFDEFLELIGEKVELMGWEGYNGGLDTSKNKTGTHSVFTSHDGHSIMWHVSTLLPFFPDDPQQLERKRHLGNDVVTVVFKEGNTPFNPACLTSQFTHAVCVVQKVENSSPTQYRVSFTYRSGCRPHTPLLTYPCIYTKGTDFKRFLLAKLINAERAAFHAPAFAEKLNKVRLLMLRELVLKASSVMPRSSRGGIVSKAGSVIAAPLVNLPLVSPKRHTGSRIERPLDSDRSSDETFSLGSSSSTPSGSRIGGRPTSEKDREKEREKERKEKEKQEKEREKAEKKEKERLEKEKEKAEKEQKKREEKEKKDARMNLTASMKEPTPRAEDPKPMSCLWFDKSGEAAQYFNGLPKNDATLLKLFSSQEELSGWLLSREAKLKGCEDTDVAEIETIVSWVRFSSPIGRCKILIFTPLPTGLEFLISPKRTYVSSDVYFCQQFATFKYQEA